MGCKTHNLVVCSLSCLTGVFNTLRPRQNGHHFPDDILKWIFVNENAWVSITMPLKFVPRGRINNIPALVQIMTSWPPGKTALIWTNDGLGYRCIYASLGVNELTASPGELQVFTAVLILHFWCYKIQPIQLICLHVKFVWDIITNVTLHALHFFGGWVLVSHHGK